MSYNIDFSLANSRQIGTALGGRMEQIRLSRNLTQSQLAQDAGISVRTLRNLEKGEGVSLDTFIRVLIALGIQHNLEVLLPDPSVRPVERIGLGKERRRARPVRKEEKTAQWSWGDGGTNDD